MFFGSGTLVKRVGKVGLKDEQENQPADTHMYARAQTNIYTDGP